MTDGTTNTHCDKIGCGGKRASRLLGAEVVIYVQEPLVNVRVVVSDHLQVAAEHRVVADIEANDGGKPELRVSGLLWSCAGDAHLLTI